jgi:4-amino-4-deoxy-L-arabinose transferase-like glycosyltransferase
VGGGIGPRCDRFAGALREAILAGMVLLAAWWVFTGVARDLPFHGDEGDYIWNGRYFAFLVLERDLRHPEWGDSYWTHTQPMLARYIVGGWLWMRGYDLYALPPYYDHKKTPEQNRREGRFPADSLLIEARSPMVALAVGGALLVYVLGRLFGGVAAGLVAVLLTLANPLVSEHMVKAIPEAPLAFFLLLALLFGVLGSRHDRGGGLPVGWAVATGLALGLSLQAKLTALFSLVALCSWVALVGLATWQCSDGTAPARLRQVMAASRGWALAIVVAVATFLVGNPHLYPRPLVHTMHLLEQRAAEMRDHRRWIPDSATDGPVDRLRYVLGGSLMLGDRLLDGDPAVWRGSPLGPILAPIGAVGLLVGIRRTWRNHRRLSVGGLLLVTALVYFVGTTATINMYWPRYLIPTCLLGSILSGLGFVVVLHRFVSLTDGSSVTHRE